MGTILVALDLRRWRAVVAHRLPNLRHACRSALSEIQLLQKLADPAIAIAAADTLPRAQVFQANRAIRAREAEHDQVFRCDAHLHRLALFVRPVIDGVHHRLLDRRLREIPKPLCLGAICVLEDNLFLVIANDVINSVARDARQRPPELLLLKTIAARAIGEVHHIDLRDREKALRRLVEEQQPDILRHRRFGRPAHHIQLATERLNGQIRRALRQRAAHLAQILDH